VHNAETRRTTNGMKRVPASAISSAPTGRAHAGAVATFAPLGLGLLTPARSATRPKQ
jgi:hypothetical protein